MPLNLRADEVCKLLSLELGVLGACRPSASCRFYLSLFARGSLRSCDGFADESSVGLLCKATGRVGDLPARLRLHRCRDAQPQRGVQCLQRTQKGAFTAARSGSYETSAAEILAASSATAVCRTRSGLHLFAKHCAGLDILCPWTMSSNSLVRLCFSAWGEGS